MKLRYKILIGVLITLLFFVLINIVYEETKKRMEICQANGYVRWEVSDNDIEPGYIECCKYSYVNHIRTRTCDIIEKNRGKQ